MIPTHQFASRPDAFGQTLTRPSRSDPGRFCVIWSMPSSEKRSWNGCGKSDPVYTIQPDSGCTLAVMAITGRNQNTSGSDPAFLLGSHNSVLPVPSATSPPPPAPRALKFFLRKKKKKKEKKKKEKKRCVPSTAMRVIWFLFFALLKYFQLTALENIN